MDDAGTVRDLHLKGSGRTPFARGGDGLAAVGPMLREYVVSEAMHALGIPTTRALAVVATGRAVRRETVLPGAVLARVASSHLRVGSFQYARATDDVDLLRRLADVAIARHHPAAADAANPYLALFEAVLAVQASLVARWMLVGFVHGVMNTDNMTISGETIDYGPCAFMEAYDPDTSFSSIDEGGRYRYGYQPLAAEWNLARLAEALLPLIDEDPDRAVALAVESLKTFRPRYDAALADGMRAKLGLPAGADDAVVADLVTDLLALLQAGHVDWTSFFRRLADAARGDAEPVRLLVLDLAGLDGWLERWRALSPDGAAMDRVNPVYIPATTSSRRRSTPPPAGTSRCSTSCSTCWAHPSRSARTTSGTPSPRPATSAPRSAPSAAPEPTAPRNRAAPCRRERGRGRLAPRGRRARRSADGRGADAGAALRHAASTHTGGRRWWARPP